MSVLAIIPARGGSKGIPRKNVRLIAGKPLLAYSIVQAKQTPSIARVLVSTDDEEIAAIARTYGAEVVARPADLSGDTASSESALLHALDWLSSRLSCQLSVVGGHSAADPDLVVFLQATSPCRRPGEIQKALDTLQRENADSLLSVSPVHGFVWRVDKDGRVRSFSYDYVNRPRRQEAPEDLIENGSIYIFKPWVLRQFNNRLGGKIALHRMSALDSFQIDEPGDFELLEFLMRYEGVGGPREYGTAGQTTTDQGIETTDPGPLSADLSKVKLLVLDFDGVLTDNRVMVSEDGKEAVVCNRADGLGIERLKQSGVEVVVLSKEKSPVVAARCAKLQVECIHGCNDKLAALQQALVSGQWSACGQPVLNGPVVRGLLADQIAYVGNDLNDLECMKWVGLPIAVGDAIPEVLFAAKWKTTKPGGHGAVREVCDLLLNSAVRRQ